MVCSENRILSLLSLWGKAINENSNSTLNNLSYHPLLFHMLDVAAVAGALWDYSLKLPLKERVEKSLGAHSRIKIMFFSGTHDIGKASPAFQKRILKLSKNIQLLFSTNDKNRPHGFISANVLRKILGPSSGVNIFSQITGGHHGVFPRALDLEMGRDTLGNNDWEEIRRSILKEFMRTLDPDLNEEIKDIPSVKDPAIVPILAGFISIADWIASNQDYFPCIAEYKTKINVHISDYWERAKKQAKEALESLGWLPAVSFAEEKLFEEVFKGFEPNDLQKISAKLISNENSPYLMILEAPMGRGKTEAALYSADVAMCRGLSSGMYIAMPTQATGNAMHRRVLDDYLRHRGHKGKLNLQLVHGDSLLVKKSMINKEGEIPEYSLTNISENDDLEAQSWFTAKKRPLLAPFGVGTIDQSLLSVLQTKHWFVRLFGLAGKVVIFDEVHAYDAYMSSILERLLHWLSELDCTVILLSATLPENKRIKLVEAYSGRTDGEYKRYPRVTLAKPRHYLDSESSNPPFCTELPLGENKDIAIAFMENDLASLASKLKEQLVNGGCAAVICNTVNRSIEVFRYLNEKLIETECHLFHARTLRKWRREKEEEVLHKFGKGKINDGGFFENPSRPFRSVLVATQVIEQSLDLDFDILFSEIAPVDLLLQRCGRMHRHNRKRPKDLEKPKLVILCDAISTNLQPDSFGQGIEWVYDRYILLKTWLTLRNKRKIQLPADIETLVESVYGKSFQTNDMVWEKALAKAKKTITFNLNESRKAAKRLLVTPPRNPQDMIEEFNDQLVDDEAPETHKSLRAATREGAPSITVIFLPYNMPLIENPDVEEVQTLIDYSAKINHLGIYHELLEKYEPPQQWERNVNLRHTRLLRLDKENRILVGNYLLSVDKNLGIVIERDGENHGRIQPH
ncbi:CRISPR-associated helicase Cas3' [Aminobacterium mobile]|jgi:CRISPR-associated endonuclease/helicase Cas3|uniref:CRISPR-associated helicase Cas3' n=1 Tax=Aminobacterium mobile TaxID=81467 RepID=UPI003314754F